MGLSEMDYLATDWRRWSDGHPLNQKRTQVAEVERLFGGERASVE